MSEKLEKGISCLTKQLHVLRRRASATALNSLFLHLFLLRIQTFKIVYGATKGIN